MIGRVARAIQHEDKGPDIDGWLDPHYIAAALAAIEAMREPTEAMLAAVRDPYMEFATDVECWRAMIDRALKEE